jgi:phosphoglycerate dehydrogenase-like enzyme
MAQPQASINIAVLDDYQNVALKLADWTDVQQRAAVTVFNDHLDDPQQLVARLAPFDALCVMRERTPLTRAILEQLPRLKLIASTGSRNISIDAEAAAERGIQIVHTNYSSDPTIEMTWALILAGARHLLEETTSLRSGGWQTALGEGLRGKTLAVLGLGRVGSRVAAIGLAFGMEVVAWSQNLTPEAAQALGVRHVSKEELFRSADILSVHLILSKRSRGLVGAPELALMKPSARLINTSRGPIVDEAALLRAVQTGQLAGAAVDVYDQEPLPADHPFRTTPKILATPHIGYVADDLYRTFYGDTVAHLSRWLDELAGAAGSAPAP